MLSLGFLALLVAVLVAPDGAQAAGDSPTVTNIAITSSPATGDTYGKGETVQVTATFSEAVTVTGVPVLRLNVGGSYRQADYTSGSGSTALVFEYTVASRDRDANGISIRQNPIIKPGAGVTIQNAGGTDANTDYSAVSNQESHKVEGFGVTNVTITSSPNEGDTYIAYETITVTATFSETVTVTGVPFMRLRVGSSIQHADYVSGSGSSAVVFQYSVTARDKDTDGVGIPRNPIIKADAAGAAVTIRAADGTDANTNYPAVSDQASHKVDGSTMPPASPGPVPTVTAMGITSSPESGDTYGKNEKIVIEVSWSVGVYIAGAPTLSLKIGGSTVQADLDEHVSGESTSTFSYKVGSGDVDTNGISIPADPIDLPDSSIIRSVFDDRDAVLTYAGLADQSGHKVNGDVGGL